MARQNRKSRNNRRDQSEFEERVVSIDRTSKVVKGGRRFGFRACVVLGDGAGRVGYGIGKARDVPEAIRKGVERAKKNMINVPLLAHTIPHTVEVEESAARVLLKPASPGTGVIAGGGVRAVVEAAGVKNILTKSLGSDNTINVVRATFAALGALQDLEKVAAGRGKTLAQVAPPWYKVEEAGNGG